MSSYTAPLTITELGGRRWRIERDFTFYSEGLYNITITVPSGFVTDGASVPRVFWSLLPQWGKYSRAAVIHDFLLDQISPTVSDTSYRYQRKLADKIFLEAMKVSKVNIATRNILYYSARIFGIWKSLVR